MRDNDGAIICLLMILNISAYENVFLEQQFCAYKGQCDVNYLEYVDILNEQQKVLYNTNNDAYI